MGVLEETNLLAGLQEGSLVITGNERLARYVQQVWDQHQRSLGLARWESANVLSWQSWLQTLWRRLLLEGRTSALLLSPLQEQKIWESVFPADQIGDGSQRREALSRLAVQAWRRLCDFRGEGRLQRSLPTLQGDAATFARWARNFEQRCRRDSLLSRATLEVELTRHLQAGTLSLPQGRLILIGFDAIPPAKEALLAAIRSNGTVVTLIAPPSSTTSFLVGCTGENEEMRACARWVRIRLEQDPAARIGVVVPGLERQMGAIDSAFRENLSTLHDSQPNGVVRRCYEFSLGRALAHEAMVRAAFTLLHWAHEPISLSSLSRLLLSPYFAGGEQELAARGEFDAQHLQRRLRLRPELSIQEALQELEQESELHRRLPLLAGALRRMAKSRQTQTELRARAYTGWADWIRSWLETAAWSVGSDLTSRDFQLRERWDSILDEIATLDFLDETAPFEQVLSLLETLARDTVFAPESQDAAVQVMGPLEAAGTRFDALWVMQVGELSWPPLAPSHALLPWSLQRELNMPEADKTQARDRAAQLTRRLAGSGAEVVFSYASVTASGAHQRAAIAVRELSPLAVSVADLTGVEPPRRKLTLERRVDDARVAPLPSRTFRGGVRLLELQAACGFRAFAELRLGTASLEARTHGLNALERGTTVHEALEFFWSRVTGQQQLRSLSSEARASLVRQAVTHALRKALSSQKSSWDEAYVAAQARRLEGLLEDWLTMELHRPEFVVAEQEQSRKNITIGPLQLSLRVDRVDVVDGHQVILDYKTGEASTTEWLSNRPEKPQVPLYAILASEASAQEPQANAPLGAVGFGQVRAGRGMKLRGFESRRGLLTTAVGHAKPPRMDAASFAEQIERWHSVLESLATEFAVGDVRVSPKQYPTTCDHCGQRMLCRVDASSFEEQFEEDPGEPGG